ncbi:MAG: ATP-binding protein [Rhodobacteraceae bacterium]|nr:MAG: ATP-binding protein [Paracoccaceae bacterium]
MLKVEGLTRLGLGPFDFTVADGECLAITGPSGAGKSVLLRAIADLDPNEGQIATAGMQREAVAAPDWRRAVALLPAESGWWADGVATHFQDARAVRPMLARVGLDQQALDWQVARLSTGERHRLALLRALEQQPQVLLLDEPTTMLDAGTTGMVEDLLKERMDRGLSIVMVTHDAEQPERIASRVMWLENGRLNARAGG